MYYLYSADTHRLTGEITGADGTNASLSLGLPQNNENITATPCTACIDIIYHITANIPYKYDMGLGTAKCLKIPKFIGFNVNFFSPRLMLQNPGWGYDPQLNAQPSL